MLPMCDLPVPTTCAVRASQEQSFEISTPRYEYWSTIGSMSSPHFQLNVFRFSLSTLHATAARRTAYSLTFAGHSPFLSILVPTDYLFLFIFLFFYGLFFLFLSGVSDIPTKLSANIHP